MCVCKLTFSPTSRSPKKGKLDILCSEYELRYPRFEKNFGCANWGGIFHHINLRQPPGRKSSIQPVLRRIRGLKKYLFKSASNFKLLLKAQGQNKFVIKHSAVDDQTKTFALYWYGPLRPSSSGLAAPLTHIFYHEQ
jgi:hypothetical protein